MPTISGVGNKSNISFSNKNIYKATNNFINQKIQQFTDAFSRKNDYETIDYNAQNVTENTTQTKDRSIVSTYLQTRATFTLSTVSGILSVGEDIADGGAIVLGGLTSKIVGKFDPEKGKAIENSVSEFVKEDYMDRLYDAAVTTIGIDEDIAYGKTHTAGNIVGNIAGYAAITLTTGGVATVAISGLAAAGNAAETALNSGATFNQTLAVSAVAGAIGALSGGALDKIGEKILIQKVVNPKTLVKYIASGSLVSMSEPVVNKVTEYLTYGKNLSDNFFDYFKETGGITNTLIAGAVGSLSVAGKAYKGYSEMKNNPKSFDSPEKLAIEKEIELNEPYEIKTKNLTLDQKKLLKKLKNVCTKKTGMELEKLFFQDEYVIGLHGTGSTALGDRILSSGLNMTQHGNVEVKNFDDINLKLNITLIEGEKSLGKFLNFLDVFRGKSAYKSFNKTADVVMTCIPKKEINNVSNLMENVNGQIRLKNEYILGYAKCSQGLIGHINYNSNSIGYKSTFSNVLNAENVFSPTDFKIKALNEELSTIFSIGGANEKFFSPTLGKLISQEELKKIISSKHF